MDRTAWIAVILSVIGLVAWEVYVAKTYPQPATVAPAPGPLAITSGKPESVVDRQAPAPAAPPDAQTGAPVAEQIETVITPKLELHFTNLGGGIDEAIPLGKEHLAEGGLNIKLNHAGHIAIGAITRKAGEDARQPYTLTRDRDTVTAERSEPDGLKIIKKYTVIWDASDPKHQRFPAVRLEVTFSNPGAQPYSLPGYYLYAGSSAPIHRKDYPTNTAFDWMTGGAYHTTSVPAFDGGTIPVIGIQTSPPRTVITDPLTKVAWIAVKNQFYATIVSPLAGPDQEAPATEIWAKRFDLPVTPEDKAANLKPLHALDAALGLPGLTLAPGESKTQAFQIYAGPKLHSRLELLGHDEQEIMNFGKFKIVSIILLNTMNTLKGWVGSYGVAIILLTMMVKLVLLYPQLKANASMRRMAALGPKLTELKAKYKDDAAKVQTETMKLYKDYGVNPLGGCLPSLIQMPIFFGFLYMLGTAAELRNSGFLWVHDLSQPDTVAHIGGLPLNVLPLLMVGTQFWQMQLTPKTGDAQQQKMFMFMPLVFGFFCYSFAAALALYYTMQGVLMIIQLYATRNQPIPTLQKREGGGGGGLSGFAERLAKKGAAGGAGGPKRLRT